MYALTVTETTAPRRYLGGSPPVALSSRRSGALDGAGLACCGRYGERCCAPGAGEKPVAFCRALVLFSRKENSTNCVWVAGGLSPCDL